MVQNEGAMAVKLFAVPFPEGGIPEDVGEMLFSTEPGEAHYPYEMAMTSRGRLFVADDTGGHRTREYTPDLGYLRSFEHPQANPGEYSRTLGLAWMPPEHAPEGYSEGTLWWMDVGIDCDGPNCTVLSTLLIEGDLDGSPTDRTVELATGPGTTGPPSLDRGVPLSLAYDAEDELFYYIDWVNEDLYALDVDGEIAGGYPIALVDYDPGDNELLQARLDASRSADGGRYLDYGVLLPGDEHYERVVVADRWGRSTGVETPLTRLESPDGQGKVVRVMGVLRSRIDPSVMYLAIFTQGENGAIDWIVAIRAAPLPPRWLRASPVAPRSLEIAPGEADTLTVRLNAEGMAPGVYHGQVSLREGGPNGEEAASVPVTLTVTEGTATEEGPGETSAALRVWPNPASRVLHVEAPGAEEAVVFDVLGRKVLRARLGGTADGLTEADVSGLPPGVYVVRAGGEAAVVTVRR